MVPFALERIRNHMDRSHLGIADLHFGRIGTPVKNPVHRQAAHSFINHTASIDRSRSNNLPYFYESLSVESANLAHILHHDRITFDRCRDLPPHPVRIRGRQNEDTGPVLTLPDAGPDHAGDRHPDVHVFFPNLLDCPGRHVLYLLRIGASALAADDSRDNHRCLHSIGAVRGILIILGLSLLFPPSQALGSLLVLPAPITVTVSNETNSAPMVSITTPAAGSTVSGTVQITAAASDDIGVA